MEMSISRSVRAIVSTFLVCHIAAASEAWVTPWPEGLIPGIAIPRDGDVYFLDHQEYAIYISQRQGGIRKVVQDSVDIAVFGLGDSTLVYMGDAYVGNTRVGLKSVDVSLRTFNRVRSRVYAIDPVGWAAYQAAARFSFSLRFSEYSTSNESQHSWGS